MASIKIDSKIVVEACEKKMHQFKHRMMLENDQRNVFKIQTLAEHSAGQLIYIDHNDFQLIGEYL